MGYSGLWDRQYGIPYAGLGVNTSEISSAEKKLLGIQLTPRGRKVLNKLMRALNGVAAGANATSTVKQIAADVGLGQAYSGGGLRVINTVTDINRNTVAADQTFINAILDLVSAPTYPVDASGNGGGGKGGRF